MNDYEQMRKYLQALDQNRLLKFCESVGTYHTGWFKSTPENNTDHVDEMGHVIAIPWKKWRKEKESWILECKSDNPKMWRDLCHFADINTDDAETLIIARQARSRSTWANIIAGFSILIAIGSLLWTIYVHDR